jgi:hypothetical protein
MPAKRVKPVRVARLAPASNGCHFLKVVEGEKVDQYHLTPLRAEAGALAYRFAKLNGEVYEVRVSPEGATSCGCKGMAYRGRCRHTAALVALRSAGKL